MGGLWKKKIEVCGPARKSGARKHLIEYDSEGPLRARARGELFFLTKKGGRKRRLF